MPIVFARLSAMIALVVLGFLATAPMVDGTHAFGHMIGVELSQDCPLWPCQFFDAAAGTMMLRVDSISGG